MSNTLADLAHAFEEICDADMQTAALEAVQAVAFVTSACTSRDGYLRVEHAAGKPASKPPGQTRYIEAHKTQLGMLRSVRIVAERVAHDMDRARERHDRGSYRPQAAGGRPAQLDTATLVAIELAVAEGRSAVAEAVRLGHPRGTYYGWVRRGKDAHQVGKSGLEVDLYLLGDGRSDD